MIDATGNTAPIEKALISEAILARLKELDLASAGGRLRSDKVARALDASLQPLRVAPDVGALSVEPGALYGQVLHATRTPDAGHALRPLLVVRWLFGSWTELVAYCNGSRSACASEWPLGALDSTESDSVRTRVVSLVVKTGLSASAAAQKVGVSVVTAQAWIASAGVGPRRRASKLTPPVLSKLIVSLANGDDIKCVAERAGVSTTSANRVLRTEVGLLGRRQAAIMERRRTDARQEWKAAVESGIGTKLARELAPGAYAWLYRNDSKWLEVTAPPRRAAPARRLDWEKRDMDLCALVHAAALELCDREPPRRIKVVELVRAVPELKST